ncbi:hypothetical protein OY671_012281 [Metschnikowia pulcherrima]|nr:hypothetical protein OY671_012281 [Metschnikowia pulcherrima]
MTKVAYGAQSSAEVHAWFAQRGPEARSTTRYSPKRHAEMVGGSSFWVLKHQLVARSPISGFEEAEGGKTHIVISTQLIDVHPVPRRAHQGWRYSEDKDAPRDSAMGEAGEALPAGSAGASAKSGSV